MEIYSSLPSQYLSLIMDSPAPLAKFKFYERKHYSG